MGLPRSWCHGPASALPAELPDALAGARAGLEPATPSWFEREPAPFRPAAVLVACAARAGDPPAREAWSAGFEPAVSGFVARRVVHSPTTRRGLLVLGDVCAARPPFDPGSAARCSRARRPTWRGAGAWCSPTCHFRKFR